LGFLNSAYKTILIFGVFGITVAIAYLVITPKQYEATALIAMAKISDANNNNNPLVVNIEEPALLISRMGIPTSYTAQEIVVCGFEGKPDSAAALAKAIKISPVKGVPNMVELKTFGDSPQSAKDCAQAITDLIKTTQAQILIPYIEEAKVKLADDEDRLNRAKDLVSKADKAGSAAGSTYLATRDEIGYLLDEITSLKNVVTTKQQRVARLIAPIYASELPISPKKRVILVGGLFGGLFLGLLITLGRRMIPKPKSEVGGAL